MPSIVQILHSRFAAAISAQFNLEADPLISVAQNAAFGDYQSNAAMSLAKRVAEATGQKTNPRQVAEKIVAAVDLAGIAAEKPSIAGPGFINVRLAPEFVSRTLADAVKSERLGVDPAAKPMTIVVDYSAPNIAKELHVGHIRSTIIGDAVARVLEFAGHKVIRQNHLGDWGTQFGMLIAHLRSLGNDAAEGHIRDLEGFYVRAKKRYDTDPAFAAEARQTVVRLQAGEKAERELWAGLIAQTRAHFQPLYVRLGVKLRPEHECGESFYNPRLPGVVADLKAAGIAVESSEPVEGEADEFDTPTASGLADRRIVAFVEGFKTPLVVQKTDGGYLYGTTDLAAVRYRVGELGAGRVLYFVDSRQGEHFAKVFAVARKAGWTGGASLEHAAFGTILGEDAKPLRTRDGGVPKLAGLLDEAVARALAVVKEKNPDLSAQQLAEIAEAIGIGAVKYGDLSKDRTSDYVFSFDRMMALEGNTAPYLQYAYARTRAIFRKAGVQPVGLPAPAPTEAAEIALAKHLLRLADVVAQVAGDLKPHALCTYLYETASLFSGFWESCPVLTSPSPVKEQRLALCDATSRTLALGLDLLGIAHPEQM